MINLHPCNCLWMCYFNFAGHIRDIW